ncbi:hypothetical protein V8E54_011651 [Elaphomyces granulatus]
MATINLMPLVILTGRNNPLIPLLGVLFDSWNFFHRSLARIVVVPKVQAEGGWAALPNYLAHDHHLYMSVSVVQWFGNKLYTASYDDTVKVWDVSTHANATCVRTLRHRSKIDVMARSDFHENLLITRFLWACVFLWLRLDGFEAQLYLLIALVLWVLEHFTRLAILLFRISGENHSVANIRALPGDAMRITSKVARPWTLRPGQRLYLYISLALVGWWTSHPFSVAWSETEQTLIDEKRIVMTRRGILALQKTAISLLVRCRRTGFTDQLYEHAEKALAASYHCAPSLKGHMKAFTTKA